MPGSPTLLGAGRRSSFSPASLSGLALWTEDRPAATLFQDSGLTTPVSADGDPLGGWKDQSGTANHLLQSTSGARPTYVSPGIQGGRAAARAPFDAGHSLTERFYTLPGGFQINAQACSIFFVLQAVSCLAQNVLACPGSTNNFVFQLESGNPYLLTGTPRRGAQRVPSNACLVGLTSTGSAVTFYVDGVASAQGAATSGTLTAGMLLKYFGASGYQFAGEASAVFIGTSAWADADVQKLFAYCKTRFGIGRSAAKQVIFDGDSLTAGYNGGTGNSPYPRRVSSVYGVDGVRWWNLGVANKTLANLTSDAAAKVDALYDGALSRNILVILGGVNDIINDGVNGATALARLKTYCGARRSANPSIKIVVVKMLPCSHASTPGTFETDRTTFNAGIDSDPTFYDAAVTPSASIFAAGASDNATYFSDKIHMTEAGYSVLGGDVNPAVAGLLA